MRSFAKRRRSPGGGATSAPSGAAGSSSERRSRRMGRILGGAEGARQRARHEPRLTRRYQRAAAVQPERGAGSFRREGAQARTAEIAIIAGWLGSFARLPAYSPKRTLPGQGRTIGVLGSV